MAKNKRTFESMTSFLDFCQQERDVEGNVVSTSTDMPSHMYRDSHWAGTDSYAEAVKLAVGGWEDGIDKVKKLAGVLTDEIIKVTEVPEIEFAVSGEMVDVGRFVAGEPEDMMTFVQAEVEQEPKVIEVVANIYASAAVEVATMTRKGAAVVAPVDALETHGKAVQLDVVMIGERGFGKSSELRVRVKESNQPLNIANVVFALAQPSMVRRLGFSCWEHEAVRTRREIGFAPEGFGYGYMGEADATERGDIYIESADSRMGDWAAIDAERWVLDHLRDQGIKITTDEDGS